MKNWKWYDRSMELVIRRFQILNKKNLEYLGITTEMIDDNGKPALLLKTSEYVGAIPIYSPNTGKAIGDLTVCGRFGEDATELISFLDNEIKPEYSEQFKLTQDIRLTSPIFVECCKYIDLYLQAERFKWRKFSNLLKKEYKPSSSTIWSEYILRTSQNPELFNIFNNKRNLLITDHKEWAQLTYVLHLAIIELENRNIPMKIRRMYSNKILYFKNKIQTEKLEAVDKISIKMSDPVVIKRTKLLAQVILNTKSNEKIAWRIDYAKTFEYYVQHLIKSIAKRIGGNSMNNPHYGIYSKHKPVWGLQYLEPDTVLSIGDKQYVIDAKYKAHMYNYTNYSDDLKDSFRHDFHQVLAYTALNNMQKKQAMLIYPCSRFTSELLVINGLEQVDAKVFLVGIPIMKEKIRETIDSLIQVISLNANE